MADELSGELNQADRPDSISSSYGEMKLVGKKWHPWVSSWQVHLPVIAKLMSMTGCPSTTDSHCQPYSPLDSSDVIVGQLLVDYNNYINNNKNGEWQKPF